MHHHPLYQPARGASDAALEAELGMPVYDTITTAVWKSLRLAGVDTRRVQGGADS